MGRLLIRNADVVATMGATGEVSNADILCEDGVVSAVGANLKAEGAEVLDGQGCVVTPGLVNTHHHLYQTLTRAVPAAQDALLFDWLKVLYPIWSRLGPDDIKASIGPHRLFRRAVGERHRIKTARRVLVLQSQR